MIERLKIKHKVEVFDFINKVKDYYEDTYITINKERKFLKNNWSLIEKTLRTQEVYGVFNNGLKGLLIILHEKGYRPYVKLLTENSKYTIDLLKFLKWNFFEVDLYFKLKKENPLTLQIKKTGFIMVGDRGRELLFFKKKMKQLYPLTPKDNYLEDNENRLY
jgi:hypothetical protein